MNNEMTNTLPFKVKCIDIESPYLTVGKEYDVVKVNEGLYKVKNDGGKTRWYYNSRFEIVETPPKDKQEFSVGDNVVVNKISDDFASYAGKNVKVGDTATVIKVINGGGYSIKLSNPNWLTDWWFYKTHVSFVGDASPLSPQEVVQATLDGKELEIQYTDGTWHGMLPTATTLRHLTLLNFRLKPPLEGKRKAVIKKLLTTKVAVLCKCWDDDGIGETIVAITRIDDNHTYPYRNSCLAYKNAIAIDDNGNEITNV